MSFDLLHAIEEALPKSAAPYHLLNVHTKPKKSKPIVVPLSKKNRPDTVKIQHYVILYNDDIPIFGIEVFVYIILHKDATTERVIFISKADTVGLSKTRINVGEVISIIMSWIFQYPVSKYLAHVREDDHQNKVVLPDDHQPFKTEIQRALYILANRAKGNPTYGKANVVNRSDENVGLKSSDKIITKLCLFTRAEPQYLFPNSDKNTSKHVLTGEGLLKWWLKLLERSISENFNEIHSKSLNILNADKRSIERYFPKEDWKVGDVFSGTDNKAVAVYKIPLFPDDPKGRFLEQLVVENRIKKVKVGQFWTELAVRQEFRLGITVGLIGVEGVTKSSTDINSNEVTVLGAATLGKITNIVANCDYSSETSAKEGCQAVIDVLGSKYELPSLHGKKNLQYSPAIINPTAGTTPINVLSVKSKSKSQKRIVLEPQQPSNTSIINDITSMSVRKKPKLSKE